MTEKILFLRAEKITERLKEMRKILSAILTLSLATTAALSLPASAASYTTDENVTFSWDMPVSADSSLEHPGLWNDISSIYAERALAGKITANDSSDGMRSFYVKAETTDGKTKTDAAYANRNVGSWRDSVKLAGEADSTAAWADEYFVYGDVKMSSDFVGTVFVTFIPYGEADWGKYGAQNAKGEYIIFDNTDDGYYKTRHNNENNGGIKTPYSRKNTTDGKPGIFTEWTRVNSLTYDNGYKFSGRLDENTGVSVQVFCLSGEVWVDNIGIWNYHVSQFASEDEVFYNKMPLPDCVVNRHANDDDGGLTFADMEESIPGFDEPEAYRGAMTNTHDDTEKFSGNKSLKIHFNKRFYEGSNFYFILPAEEMEKLDISTKYHIELAVKGAENAKGCLQFTLEEQDREKYKQINVNNDVGMRWVNGLGLVNPQDTYVIPNTWDIYSTNSFGVTGGKLVVRLYVRGTENTDLWIDDIRLVPDRTETVHGKVYGKFDKETQKYTVTAVADPGYELESLSVVAYNSITPAIADRTNALTTVYSPYSFGRYSADGDLYLAPDDNIGEHWKWPSVSASFKLFEDLLPGDVNLDGDINILDMIKLKKYLSKSITDFSGIDLYSANMTNPNMDKDGDFEIDTADMAALRKYLLTNSLS